MPRPSTELRSTLSRRRSRARRAPRLRPLAWPQTLMIDLLRQDWRYALRTFVRNPGFAVLAILTVRHRRRREHRHLQHRQRRAAPPAAVCGSRCARARLAIKPPDQAEHGQRLSGQLSRLAEAEPKLHVAHRLSRRELHALIRRSPGTGDRRAGQREFLRRAGRGAGIRPRVQGGRRGARRASRGPPQRWALETAFRRRADVVGKTVRLNESPTRSSASCRLASTFPTTRRSGRRRTGSCRTPAPRRSGSRAAAQPRLHPGPRASRLASRSPRHRREDTVATGLVGDYPDTTRTRSSPTSLHDYLVVRRAADAHHALRRRRVSCCWLQRPTSPACSSPGPPHAITKWPSGSRLARRGGGFSDNCLPKRAPRRDWRRLRRAPAMWI